MLPSDMNLKIKLGTVGYNNKILVSNCNFSLVKNDEVNETPKISHQSTITHHELANSPWAISEKNHLRCTHQPTKVSVHSLFRGPVVLIF